VVFTDGGMAWGYVKGGSVNLKARMLAEIATIYSGGGLPLSTSDALSYHRFFALKAGVTDARCKPAEGLFGGSTERQESSPK
jgi:hypothetical protein